MDTLTHFALGACTGELILGKKMGKKAMLFGGLAANIPDLDIIPGLFVRADSALLIHRGITHSFFFALAAGLLLGLLIKKRYPAISLRVLWFFFSFELALHDLLDTCTSYGTGLFEPFSHHRFSVHLIYVVDPLFSVWLFAATVYLIRGKRHRAVWAVSAIGLSVAYLAIAGLCKQYTDDQVNASMTTPAPFTTLLWYCIQKKPDGYNTGYYSVFDSRPIHYTYHPRNDSLLTQPEPYLKTFADGYYTISREHGYSWFNILRFGQMQGWLNGNAPFVLSYPAGKRQYHKMSMQKDRLSGWNATSIKNYLERIAGI